MQQVEGPELSYPGHIGREIAPEEDAAYIYIGKRDGKIITGPEQFSFPSCRKYTIFDVWSRVYGCIYALRTMKNILKHENKYSPHTVK